MGEQSLGPVQDRSTTTILRTSSSHRDTKNKTRSTYLADLQLPDGGFDLRDRLELEAGLKRSLSLVVTVKGGLSPLALRLSQHKSNQAHGNIDYNISSGFLVDDSNRTSQAGNGKQVRLERDRSGNESTRMLRNIPEWNGTNQAIRVTQGKACLLRVPRVTRGSEDTSHSNPTNHAGSIKNESQSVLNTNSSDMRTQAARVLFIPTEHENDPSPTERWTNRRHVFLGPYESFPTNRGESQPNLRTGLRKTRHPRVYTNHPA